jgi:hypothetical protein
MLRNLLCLLVFVSLACSSFSQQIPDYALATISYPNKEAMRLAKEDVDQALALSLQGSKALKEHEAFLEMAEKEQELAQIQLEVSNSALRSAEASGRAAETSQAKSNVTLSTLALEMAESKLAFAKSSLAYAKAEIPLAELRVTTKQWAYELAKLELLDKHKISHSYSKETIRKSAGKYQKELAKEEATVQVLKKRKDAEQGQYDTLRAQLETAKQAPNAGKTMVKPTLDPAKLPTEGMASQPTSQPQ